MFKFSFFSILFVSLFLNSCKSKSGIPAKVEVENTDTIKEKYTLVEPVYTDLESFLKGFEAAVLSNDPGRILPYMDKDYLREQHDSLLQGRTYQFLNEFFSGNSLEKQTFVKADYKKITAITRNESNYNTGYYAISYSVFIDNNTIKCTWIIMTKLENGKPVFGLYGAVG